MPNRSQHRGNEPAGNGARRDANVIILTAGLAGSSALAGLLKAAGYWCGEDTFRKIDYNTHENVRLIELNRQLMARVGIGEEYTRVFDAQALERLAELPVLEPRDEYTAFVEQCNAHAPWVWKDPRLWLTMDYWLPMLDLERTKVILLTRDPLQSWVSSVQRRQIMSFKYLNDYNRSIKERILRLLEGRGVKHLALRYEDLVCTPEAQVQRLTEYLGRPITMAHLTSSYEGELYRRPKGWRDLVEASLIYAKNYGERLR